MQGAGLLVLGILAGSGLVVLGGLIAAAVLL